MMRPSVGGEGLSEHVFQVAFHKSSNKETWEGPRNKRLLTSFGALSQFPVGSLTKADLLCMSMAKRLTVHEVHVAPTVAPGSCCHHIAIE